MVMVGIPVVRAQVEGQVISEAGKTSSSRVRQAWPDSWLEITLGLGD